MSDESEDVVIRTSEYAFTADEGIQMWRETKVRWKSYIFVVGSIFGLLALVCVTAAIVDKIPWLGVLLCLMVAAFGALYPLWVAWRIRRRRTALEAAGKLLSQWHEFDGRFFTTHLSNGEEYRIMLKTFVNYIVTNGILYLYEDPTHYTTIPLRAIGTKSKGRIILSRLQANHAVRLSKHPKQEWGQ